MVHGFNRLKHHLGGVGSDVIACARVPDNIKLGMKNSPLEKKKGKLLKVAGDLYHPQLPLKRNLSSPSSRLRCSMLRPSPPTSPENVNLASENASSSYVEPMHQMNDMKPFEELGANSNVQVPVFIKIEGVHVVVEEEENDQLALLASNCIGRFFYEAGINLDVIKLASFLRMIDAVVSCGRGYKAPISDELKGWILEHELKEVQGHVNVVKCSWEQTGCSILLDCWTGQKGRNLIRFLANCPKGTIFLRSVETSDGVTEINALFSLISGVVEEGGGGGRTSFKS